MFGENPQMAKKAALHVCHRYSGKKLKEIGTGFGVGESAISQSNRRFETEMTKDKRLRRQVEKLNLELRLSHIISN